MRKALLPSSLLPVLWLLVWLAVAVLLHGAAPASSALGRPALVPPHHTAALEAKAAWPFVLEAQGLIPQPPLTPTAHASNLLSLPNDPSYSLAAFWFAGSEEGAEDVRIVMSLWSRTSQAWTTPTDVVNRHTAGAALGKGLRRLGNPVAWLDQQQRLHLFVVATGMGGWAAGRVLHLQQAQAQSPLQADTLGLDVVGLLPLSWFWNISHLVRHAPLPLADGGMVLPVYFELGAKYPVFAWFSPLGEFQGVRRFTGRRNILQAAPVAVDASHWLAYLRTQAPNDRVAVLESWDAGLNWALQDDLPLSNTDSAIAALRLPQGSVVMARNPQEGYRSQLLWQHSPDGLHWSEATPLVQGEAGSEYAYPALAWQDDRLWVSYTHQRQGIAWQRWRLKTSAERQP